MLLRTGIFGGSFNPIHSGHIAIAEYFYRSGLLDEVWLVVSPQNPLKDESVQDNAEQRLQACREVLKDKPYLKISDIEFQLPRPSYMAQTLKSLQERHPDRVFSLIIGGDNLDHFERWKDYPYILEHFDVLVYPRPGSKNQVPPAWKRVRLFEDVDLMDISSTQIREAQQQTQQAQPQTQQAQPQTEKTLTQHEAHS